MRDVEQVDKSNRRPTQTDEHGYPNWFRSAKAELSRRRAGNVFLFVGFSDRLLRP
jgi:hypothetical protein